MGSLVELGSAILSQSQRRVEAAAQNVANVSTPGYKSRTVFARHVDPALLGDGPLAEVQLGSDFSAGKLIQSGNPYDLSLGQDGFFTVRSGERLLYTRQGQFHRDAEGRLATPSGAVLQASGGDLVLKGGAFSVGADALALENGQPVGKLAIVEISDSRALRAVEAGLFEAPEGATREAADPMVRQGALEASNVSMGEQMVAMMEALRRAEGGQRLVNVYDDLMGRALTSFGQSAQ